MFGSGLVLYVPINGCGHVRTVSSPYHTFFFLGRLDLAVNRYSVHILSLVADNNPSRISGRHRNDHRNYFMINLHESLVLGGIIFC